MDGRRLSALLCLFFLSSLGLGSALTSTACGGILTLEEDGDQGAIEYKLGQSYENNELCIWTIRASQRNKIYFQLEHADFESGFDYLHVHSYPEHPGWGEIQNSTDRMRAPGQLLEVVGPLAFVVFSSDSTVSGTGFQLFFHGSERNTTGGYPTNCNYTDIYSATAPGQQRELIHFPATPGTTYGRFELTSIVLPPSNLTSLPLESVQIKFTRSDLNQFDDRIYLIEVSRDGWVLRASFRYNDVVGGYATSGRAFIVIFRSYNYRPDTFTGFTIE